MEKEKAKLLLSVYRQSAPDADDPIFAPALEAARKDPELTEWFAADQEMSSAISERLSEVCPPPDLRAKILAGASISQKKPWYRRSRSWFSIAAGILLLLGSATLWINRPYVSGEENYAAYRVDMTTFLSRFFLLDHQSDKIDSIQSWLESEHGVTDFDIPQGLASAEGVGCEVIDWHGQKSYLICFDVEGELVHLLLLPGGGSIDGAPEDPSHQYAAIGEEWSTVSWSKGEDLYLVATLGGESFLRDSLGTTQT